MAEEKRSKGRQKKRKGVYCGGVGGAGIYSVGPFFCLPTLGSDAAAIYGLRGLCTGWRFNGPDHTRILASWMPFALR